MPVYVGDDGPDLLQGSPDADTILGRGGDDTLDGGGGDDLIFGGQGDDQISVGAGSTDDHATVYGGEGSDTVVSAGGTNTIVGDTGVPSVDATSGGADYIDVSLDLGADLVLGNFGDDDLTKVNAVLPSFGEAAPTDTMAGGYGSDTIDFSTFDGGYLFGNQGDDQILAFGGSNTVFGGLGDDTISTESSGTGNLTAPDVTGLVVGGEGDDTIIVEGGNNIVLGGTGNPAIDSIAGANGDGADLIVIDSGFDAYGNDLVLGNFGDDTIDASAQLPSSVNSDTLVGGQGDDLILAGAEVDNLIFGNQGDDVIVDTLSSGVDTLLGGQGDDTITYGDTASVGSALIFGGEGANFISVVGGGDDTVFGGVGALDAAGNGDGGDYIDLSGIASQAGSAPVLQERVYGGSGADAVSVGSAIDAVTITGAGGANRYGFRAGPDASGNASNTVTGGAGSGLDAITDFVSGTDELYLQDAAGAKLAITGVYGAGSEASQADLTAAANAAVVVASIQGANAATFSYSGSDYVVADADGDGRFSAAADVLIDIAGTTSLTKNDFL